jgi:hypothetical protein
MMDTLGAIVAPLTALWLLQLTSHNYHQVLAWTLVPGILAALTFASLLHNIFYAAFDLPWRLAIRPRSTGKGDPGWSVRSRRGNGGPYLCRLRKACRCWQQFSDSLAAELVPQSQHGMAFGTLAAVNAVGDFASSFVIGILWTAASPSVAFGLSGMLFLLGSVLVLRSR